MSNVKFDTQTKYFSGQGVMLLGITDPVTREVLGYEPAGNVSEAKINTTTQVIEEKNSQDGQRGVDLRLQTETKVAMSFTTKNFKPSIIARAVRGGYTDLPAATGISETGLRAVPGLVTPLQRIKVSSFVLKYLTVAMTDYTVPGAAWDYKVNLDAGSFMLNDGSVESTDKIGDVPTAITVGATTSITVPNTSAVGDRVRFMGFIGADAADLNGKVFTLSAAASGSVTIALVTTGKTITVAAGTRMVNLTRGHLVTAEYNYAGQVLVDALTKPLASVPVRFEGLNTADEDSPVIVNVWKFSGDPLQELSLITDTVNMQTINGSVLVDSTKVTGSKYYTITRLPT